MRNYFNLSINFIIFFKKKINKYIYGKKIKKKNKKK